MPRTVEAVLICLCGTALAAGQDRAGAGARFDPDVIFQQTLGGLQFWGDELFFRDWRIQRHAVDGHCRLLDPANVRRASGTFDQCLAELEKVKRKRSIPPMKGSAVLVLHGLGRTRGAMASLCRYLAEQGGYSVVNIQYPGTRQSIAASAGQLASIIRHLDGIDQVDLVGHSLGNLVVRHYLADQSGERPGRGPDPRLHRMVMLGPPNHGASMATLLADNALFKAVTGQPGQELGRLWPWEDAELATPRFEFGIIAGGRGARQGFNPLIPGDNDGLISVETTRLGGAADFLVVPALHAQLHNDPRVWALVLRFLRFGCFVDAQHRHPIVKTP
jgi:pimeloyl-ACP methyl ester carboxylesterase